MSESHTPPERPERTGGVWEVKRRREARAAKLAEVSRRLAQVSGRLAPKRDAQWRSSVKRFFDTLSSPAVANPIWFVGAPAGFYLPMWTKANWQWFGLFVLLPMASRIYEVRFPEEKYRDSAASLLFALAYLPIVNIVMGTAWDSRGDSHLQSGLIVLSLFLGGLGGYIWALRKQKVRVKLSDPRL